MKLYLITLLCFSHTLLYAQDDEAAKEGFDRLPKNIIRREIASFSTWGLEERDPAVKLKRIPFKSSNANHTAPASMAVYSNGNITVTIRSKPFDKSKYKLTYNDGYLRRINGKYFFGTDGGLPNSVISSVEIIMGIDTLRLPARAYSDLFEPNYSDRDSENALNQVYISPDNRRIYIFMTNSDGAGAYEVTWIIQDKKYLRRIVDYGF